MLKKTYFVVAILFFSFCLQAQRPEYDKPKEILAHEKDSIKRFKAMLTASNDLFGFSADTTLKIKTHILNWAIKKIKTPGPYKSRMRELQLLQSTAYNAISFTYYYQGQIKKAFETSIKCFELSEQINDTINLIESASTLGAISINLRDSANGEKYMRLAIKYSAMSPDKNNLALALNNLGYFYIYYNVLDSSLKYFNQSLKLRREAKDIHGEALSLMSLGQVCRRKKQFNEGASYILEASEKYKLVKDNEGLGGCYTSLSALYIEAGKMDLALKYGKMGLERAQLDKFPKQIEDASNVLLRAYKKTGDWKNAFALMEINRSMHDSIFNLEIKKQTDKQLIKHEFEKKAVADSIKNIEANKREKLKHEQEIAKQRTYTFGGIIGFVLMLLIAGLSFIAYRQKQKSNVLIQEQKAVVDQKNKEILDSITYAKRIQEAILPSDQFWQDNLKNSFVLYKPKDIVAGDFYWLEKVNDIILFAAADCTGHGVPGSLVSVVCRNELNRAVFEFGLTDPGKILDKTRELVISTFEKSDKDVKDGMDISLCAFSTTTLSLQWAGANNPLWYISEKEFYEVNPDKQPIGKYTLQKPFTTHSIQLKKGDILYLFTDGFADQFGGPKGKKFKYKQLNQLLIEISSLPVNEQSEILNKKFNEWKGSLEQVDDVCVIGVKV